MRKERIIKIIKTFAVIAGAGLMYAVFYKITGIGIPCLFRQITGFECPGCGVTHMCMALLALDFETAWQSNPAIFSLLIPGAVMAVYTTGFYIKYGKWPRQRWYNAVIGMMIVILIVFGVWRNLAKLLKLYVCAQQLYKF